MTNPLVGITAISGPSLAELDARARDIFRRVVETYLETGEPVGSRTISRAGIALSPASIRNTMQDLAELGLLDAPHISAGRMPTHVGLRLFVDGLMEVGDIAEEDRRAIEARLTAHGRSIEDALNEASSILSGLAGGAGVVVAPSREAGVKHVEFVALGADQTLVIMVFDDGQVENRLMRRPPGVTPSALTEASNFLNARMRGRTLAEARTEVDRELERARRELDSVSARLVEDGLAAWGGGGEMGRALIVRGRANLLGDPETLADLERVRMLFDDLEQKEQLIGLLDLVRDAEGVRIFIGAETRLFSLSGSAVIAAPYMSGRQKVLGAIGVI
ncbi:MAG TPA: heat-inducible transcriptional repressor HrcA, partial [Caulobacteraceae bacterium]|nr:heat-inducible transcriptional repressor HrcA [Caulobacteraceae bacterium]